MGFYVQTVVFKIGDEGIVQADNGSGGTAVTVSAKMYPKFGQTIINVISAAMEVLGGYPVTCTPDNGSNFWHVIGGADDMADPYPIAAGTPVATATFVAAD